MFRRLLGLVEGSCKGSCSGFCKRQRDCRHNQASSSPKEAPNERALSYVQNWYQSLESDLPWYDMDRFVSFRYIKNDEDLASPSSFSLSDMFQSCSTTTLNTIDIEIVGQIPQEASKLPQVAPSQVYADLNMFHLKSVSRVKVKEVVSEVQENCDTTQTIALSDPKEIQAESKHHGTKYLHLRCIQVGINALTHKGLNNFVLCTVRDLTHNTFTDSLIGGIVSPLCNGPVWFESYTNFSVYFFDEHLADILKLQIKTSGFDMRSKRTNISIQIRACFRHTNTLYLVVLHSHSPSQYSQASTLVITDALNQKIEHQTIRWDQLAFPSHWVFDTPHVPKQRAITTANI